MQSTVFGRVKWYNHKTGYGFITHDNADIFAHHTGIRVDNKYSTEFKYLVQGEYVEFMLTPVEGKPPTATSITGIRGGPLMCETRIASRAASGPRSNAR